MRIYRLAAAAFAAALLAACQTIGSGPGPAAIALLEREGFTSGDASQLNRDLTPDDIRTTSLYFCEQARCGGLGIVAYGLDPATSGNADELLALQRMSRAKAIRTASRVLRSAGLKGLSVTNVESAVVQGQQIISLDLNGRIAGEMVHVRLTAAYRDGPGQVVAAISGRRDIAMRFGGRAMLGL